MYDLYHSFILCTRVCTYKPFQRQYNIAIDIAIAVLHEYLLPIIYTLESIQELKHVPQKIYSACSHYICGVNCII